MVLLVSESGFIWDFPGWGVRVRVQFRSRSDISMLLVCRWWVLIGLRVFWAVGFYFLRGVYQVLVVVGLFVDFLNGRGYICGFLI